MVILENIDIDKAILQNIESIQIWHIEQGYLGDKCKKSESRFHILTLCFSTILTLSFVTNVLEVWVSFPEIYFRKMATWKNFEFKMWLKEINASCLSQEKLKLEAMKFSEKFDNVDKKTISKICDDFEKEHKKIWKEAS